jgi:ribosomal protein S18 acetylase RimI-like enzyme
VNAITPGVEIRRIRSSDWARLQRIRLRALAEDPEAFGSSLECERIKPRAWWQEWAEQDSVADDDATFLAIEEERPVGLIKAFRLDSQPDTAAIVAMWVETEKRRKGIGSRLLDAVTSWAVEGGIERLELEVTETNSAADELYRRAGFAPTGKRRSLASNSRLQVIQMERSLERP